MAEYYYVVVDKMVGDADKNGKRKVKTIVAGPYSETVAEDKVDDTLGRSDILNADVKSCPYRDLGRATQTFKEKKWSNSRNLDDAINRMGHQLKDL